MLLKINLLAPEYPGYGISEDRNKSADSILSNSRIIMEHIES